MKNIHLKLLLIIISILIMKSSLSQDKLPEDKDLNMVYLEDLCKTLSETRDYLLLDVRSAGEYSDTSQYKFLNLGRFNNAVNIDINELEKRLSEIEDHKNKPVFVYCSHSNRSRGACKILSDAGFRNVINVNGGISEFLFDNIQCSEELYTYSLSYRLYTPEKCKELLKTGDVAIIDIRSTAEFNSNDTNEYKNIGRLKGAVNIPFSELEGRLKDIPKNKKIILYDFDNSLSPKAAELLLKNGISDVGIMIYGLYSWVYKFGSDDADMVNTPDYKIINYLSTLDILKNSSDVLLLDVRSEIDYNNKNKMEHFNIGHLKGSVNIPAEEIEKRINELESFKNRKILVYGNLKESKAPDVCKYLQKNGFNNVLNAAGGYYKFIWNRKNIKNYDFPSDIIINP